MKSGNINQYKHLSRFKDLKDFNNNIEQWMIELKKILTTGEELSFKRLVRFCCKEPGVSNAKIQTIVAATHEKDGAGISRSTFERMLRKAKKYGVITVYNTYCGSNQRHNVYIFNPYTSIQEEEQVTESKTVEYEVVEVVSETNTIDVPETIDAPNLETSNSEANNNINIRTDNVIKDIPVEFQDLALAYYSPKQVIELWKCVKNSTRYLTYMEAPAKAYLSIRSFKQMICNLKLGYNIKNIYGYYNGILNNLLNLEYMEIVREV